MDTELRKEVRRIERQATVAAEAIADTLRQSAGMWVALEDTKKTSDVTPHQKRTIQKGQTQLETAMLHLRDALIEAWWIGVECHQALYDTRATGRTKCNNG